MRTAGKNVFIISRRFPIEFLIGRVNERFFAAGAAES